MADHKKDKTAQALQDLLALEENKFCADCPTRGPRWASWNLGVFLCMRCAGLHRNLGAHITKIKSISLDQWKPEQVEFMRTMGNRRSNELYMALADQSFQQPTDQDDFIRRKYQRKEWFAPPEVAATHRQVSAVPGSVEQKYAHQITQLNGMGFTNMAVNIDALTKAKGDVNVAIEDLIVRTSGGSPQPHQEPVAPPVDRVLQGKLDTLVSMGFTNMNLNRSALQKFNGDLNLALEEIIARGDDSPLPPSIPGPPRADPWLGTAQGTSSPDRSTAVAPAAAPRGNIANTIASDDLLGGYSPSASSNATHAAPPIKSKQDILSLYETPSGAAQPYNGNPFSQPLAAPTPIGHAISVVPIYGTAGTIPYGYGAQPNAYAAPPATGVNPFLTPGAPVTGPNPFHSPSLQRAQWGTQSPQQQQPQQQHASGDLSDPFAGLSLNSRGGVSSSQGGQSGASAPSW